MSFFSFYSPSFKAKERFQKATHLRDVHPQCRVGDHDLFFLCVEAGFGKRKKGENLFVSAKRFCRKNISKKQQKTDNQKLLLTGAAYVSELRVR